MAISTLKIDARRKRILDILNRDGVVRVAQLSDELDMTVVTIRNDLNALERDGYLERVQGGAIQAAKNFHNQEFLHRKQHNRDIKKKVAFSASSLIRDGDSIFLNSGTTSYYTAIELKGYKNLSIVTNSLLIAEELGVCPSFRVLLLGGEINAQYSFTYGSDVLEQLRRYRADYAILSMDGVCLNGGLTTYHAEEAIVDRLMMERAGETIIIADHNKLGKEGFSFVADLKSKITLVTDDKAERSYVENIRALGIRVVSH